MAKKKVRKKPAKKTFDLTPIVDLHAIREVRQDLDNRCEDRFEISEYMDLRCEVGDLQGLSWVKAELVDVSRTGCGCQIEKKFLKQLLLGESKELRFRIWFRNGQELPLTIMVCRTNEIVRAGKTYVVLGCQLDQTTPAYAAYSNMVDFVECISTLHRQMRLSKVSVAA